MTLRQLLATAAMVFFLAAPAMADESLNDAMAKAYLNNPDLSASRAQLRATDELAPQARAGYLPSVTADAYVGVLSQDRQVGGNVSGNTKGASVSVSQPLFRGGRTLAAIDEADSSIAAQRAVLHDTEQTVLLSAAQAFLDVVRDQAVLELNQNNEAVLSRQLRAAKDRFDVGEVTRTDVSQAEARLAGARSSRVQAEGALTQSRASYARVVGEKPARLTQPKVSLQLPASEDAAMAEALDNSPVFQAASHTREAADAALSGVKGERLPTVSLVGEAATADNSTSAFGRTDTAQATVQLSWPLYTAGSTSSRIRQAKQTVMQRSSQVEGARRQVEAATTQAWEQLQTARSVIVSSRSQVQAARVALDGVQQEAVVGSRTVLDTLDAEQELLNAQVALVRAEHDEILAQYQVLAAVGRLTAPALGLPVDYYDETAYAKKVRHKFIGSSVE